MMRPHTSSFFFWGERPYVQGAHILSGILAFIQQQNWGSCDALSAAFPFPLDCQAEFEVSEDKTAFARNKAQYATTCIFSTGRTERYLGLRPRSDLAITERRPDDEVALTECFRMTGERSGELDGYPPQRKVEAIVAATKKIHLHCLPSDRHGRWLIARLDLSQVAELSREATHVSMTLEKVIGGKMTMTKLSFNGKGAGNIFFNRKEAA